MTINRENLILQLHELGSVQFGSFTMASGLQSPIYIDLRRIIARPPLLKQVAQAYARLLEPLSYDHIAAVPYGALAIGTAISLLLDRPFIFPRKEAKSHGTGRVIEGLYSPGDRVVVVEDLVTKGGSALKAIHTLEAAHLVVKDVAVLIDREQGGPEALAQAGYQVHSVLKLSEILPTLHQAGKISQAELTAVQTYLETAGHA